MKLTEMRPKSSNSLEGDGAWGGVKGEEWAEFLTKPGSYSHPRLCLS